jgi:spore germination cell wall hydrolase CwlJ-like protein
MNITHDDNATTWRDLTDQLTAEQVDKLAGMERRSRSSAQETAEALLEGAREWAQNNLTDKVMFGHIAPPPDPGRHYHWEQDDEGQWSRRFEGGVGVVTVAATATPVAAGPCRAYRRAEATLTT